MLSSICQVYKKQCFFDKIIYLIIFLLPIFTISVRTWVSGVFVLLFLLSIGYLFFDKENKRQLETPEKYYIYIMVFYFFIYILSALVHGWGKPQTHILGTMLHFITIIPMYIMFRHLKYLLPALIVGSIVACVVNVIYLYDNPVKGIYGYLFSGPMIFLSCVIILPLFRINSIHSQIKLGLLFLMLISIFTIFGLGARSAMVALIFVTILYTMVYTRGTKQFIAIVLILISSFVVYNVNDNVKMRIDRISNGLFVYFNEKDLVHATEKLGSIHDIAARFEMWRASKYFVIENPIIGFGPDEYENEIKKLIDKELINSVAYASHPHNAYLHELYAKGILGLIAMLLVLYYPCYVFIRYFKINSNTAITGLSVVLSLTAFSLTESAAFNNNNFSSIMLIYLSILFSALFQNKVQLKESHHE